MALMNEMDYWEFTAEVYTGTTVSVGTAVELVKRTDGNPIPYCQPATADNDDNDDPRTTYVGVAMKAGAAGDSVTIRPWADGTMPALVSVTGTMNPGHELYWDGDKFDTSPTTTQHTAVNMSKITSISGTTTQIAEVLVVKGGMF
jgi:hypothetical protein